jgi:hypothetical protein
MYRLNEDKLKQVIGLELHANQEKILSGMRRFTTVRAGRRFGKTILASYLALKYLCLPNKTTWIVAPTYDLAKRTWKYLYGWVLREFPNMKVNQSTLSIVCEQTQSTLELKSADSPASCIGAGLDFLICDEASRIKRHVWEEALYPTLSDKQGKAFLISTPLGRDWFFEIDAKDHPDYASFHFESKDNLALEHMTEEQEKARETLPERVWRQEYLAEYIEDAGNVFRGVKDCIKGKMEDMNPEHTYVMGVDLAKYQDWTVITVIDLTTFGVVYMDRFNQIEWEYQREKVKKVAKTYRECPIVIDGTGVGDPMAEALKRDGYLVKDYKYTNASKKYLIENLALKIERKEVSFPEVDYLISELYSFGFEYNPISNTVRYNAPEGMHDDAVNSLALAVWGAGHYRDQPVQIKESYKPGTMGHLYEQIESKKYEDGLDDFI